VIVIKSFSSISDNFAMPVLTILLHDKYECTMDQELMSHAQWSSSLGSQVHAFICKSLTLSSTPQSFIWFSCFSYLSSQNLEFLTASHSAVSNTLFI